MNILCKFGSLWILLMIWGLPLHLNGENLKYMDTVTIPWELNDKKLECVFNCLAKVENAGKIFGCYSVCKDPPKIPQDNVIEKVIVVNKTIGLICRDDRTLTVAINVTDTVVIQLRVSDGLQETIYLTNSPFGLIDSLHPGKNYKISGYGVRGNTSVIREHFTVDAASFRTLMDQDVAEEVSDIRVVNYRPSSRCKDCLLADVVWNPSSDNVCHYTVAWHDNYIGDLHEIPLIVELAVNPKYTVTIGDLAFEQEYKVSVRSFMHYAGQPKNDFDWKGFVTPSCRDVYTKPEDIHRNCPPLKPANVAAKAKSIGDFAWNIWISWDKPDGPQPHGYIVTIRSLNHTDPSAVNLAVAGNQTVVEFCDFQTKTSRFEVTVEAVYANGKHAVKTFEMSLSRDKVYENMIIWIVATVSASLILILLIFLYRKSLFCQDTRTPAAASKDDCNMNSQTVVVDIHNYPWINDSFEVDPQSVAILDTIGEGQFGIVKKGRFFTEDLIQIPVAVKMLKDSPSYEDIDRFLSEILIMKSVPKHPNILSTVGHCTRKDTQMLLLTEYCANGNLLKYLRTKWMIHKNHQARWSEFSDNFVNFNQPHVEKFRLDKDILDVVNRNVGRTYHVNIVQNPIYMVDAADDSQATDDAFVTLKSLLHIALQVAEGMKFLGANKVIHRDLAARNVLITADNVVKIADFGLSRDITDNGLYLKQGNGRVPIKWMALEALNRQVYTTQSDVWSFGVLLYEIITLGCIPYPTVENDHLIDFLESGRRMGKPPNCSQTLYRLMLSCWAAEGNQRPTFDVIIEKLQEEKYTLKGDVLVDLEKLEEDRTLVRDNPATFSSYLTPIVTRSQYLSLRDIRNAFDPYFSRESVEIF